MPEIRSNTDSSVNPLYVGAGLAGLGAAGIAYQGIRYAETTNDISKKGDVAKADSVTKNETGDKPSRREQKRLKKLEARQARGTRSSNSPANPLSTPEQIASAREHNERLKRMQQGIDDPIAKVSFANTTSEMKNHVTEYNRSLRDKRNAADKPIVKMMAGNGALDYNLSDFERELIDLGAIRPTNADIETVRGMDPSTRELLKQDQQYNNAGYLKPNKSRIKDVIPGRLKIGRIRL